MRFTKIPLIATLMAVALSLLIVLPALAQQGYDDTRGTLSGGAGLTVDVLNGATGTDIAGSYFNGTLYVSNDDGAHHRVRITATGATRDSRATLPDPADSNNTISNPNEDCATATIKNNRSGKSIKVLLDDDQDDNIGVFRVIDSGEEEMAGACEDDSATTTVNENVGAIPARHGDTLTVTAGGVNGSVMLTVDAEGPDFSEISPADGIYFSSTTVKFRFVVTDSDSGLAHDGELDYTQGDLDARAVNTDNDQFTTGEPLSTADGSARDIDVLFNNSDSSKSGTSGWRQRDTRPGVSYFLDMAVTNQTEGPQSWRLEATDRAGNTESTDADPDDSGDQDYGFTVDVTSPEFRDARTGISYDTSKREEVVDRSSIAVTFEEGDGDLDAVMDVDVDKFRVDGYTVVGAIQPGSKSDCKTTTDEDDRYPKDIDGNCLGSDDKPQSRVYLQLAEELPPNARPQVSMFGGAVLDLAGNPGNQDEVIPADFIAPGIMATLVTDVTGRPVITRNGEVSISITSDEDLRRLPRVFFVELVDGGSSDDEKQSVRLGTGLRQGSRVSGAGEENAWQRTYGTSEVGSDNGLYAVIVVGEDENDNVGATAGWVRDRTDNAPVPTHKADLEDLTDAGLLVEIDKVLAEPTFMLTPETGMDTDETESANPFITVDFKDERNEYGNYVYKEGHDKADETISNFGDSHSAAAITSITLNGNDVSDWVSSVSNRKYTVGLRDLAVGSYELEVTGMDDVGNEESASYDFEVVARKPYEIELIPGWNLVSVPGTPLDSSIGSVMSGTMDASIVLGYQNDGWLAAVNDSGTWRGELTDIVGGYGYWVQTTAFETISTLIPETDTSSTLPTARVIKGWNLLGVVDVEQASAGKVPSGGGEADTYFGNIAWKVAYAFNTSENQWTKSIPKAGNADEVLNGMGYWVWSTAEGTLVP